VQPLTTYTYTDSDFFSVATAPKRVTDLVLQPGEKLVAQPTAGDASLWVITVVDSVQRDEPQQHVYVKPLRSGTSTNLAIATNRRTYHLELTSSSTAPYMAAVAWRYPLDDAERRRREQDLQSYEHRTTTQIADLKALHFDYRLVATGAPSWKPSMVFDDGKRTFIRFPTRVTPERSPVLLVLRSGAVQSAKYVNYRITNDLYVVDRIIDVAELRMPASLTSSGVAQVVRITREGSQ
jgi:type IV secretion system protein VirB9